jgi:mono/diheme cytochrome c family protein
VALIASAPFMASLAQEMGSIVGGNPLVGRELVEQQCGDCHSSGYAGLLVSGSRLSQDDIAERVKDQATLLRALHYQRHPVMPQFLFSESQMNDILAYFAKLREGGMQYPLPESPNR